jgi:transposase
MTNGSESRTYCPANPVMSASPPTTIADSSKQCSTATPLEFPWRDLPERFGDWKNTHKRLSRWAKKGAWQRLFEHLAAEADNEYAMIDSTIVRAHQHRAGAPKKDDDQAIGRSKGGLSTKIHALVDALGNPLRFLLPRTGP